MEEFGENLSSWKAIYSPTFSVHVKQFLLWDYPVKFNGCSLRSIYIINEKGLQLFSL